MMFLRTTDKLTTAKLVVICAAMATEIYLLNDTRLNGDITRLWLSRNTLIYSKLLYYNYADLLTLCVAVFNIIKVKSIAGSVYKGQSMNHTFNAIF